MRGRQARWAVLACLCLVLVVAGAAALAGSGPLLTGEGPARDYFHRTPAPSPTPSSTASPDAAADRAIQQDSKTGGVIGFVLLVLGALFCAAVTVLAVRLLQWWARRLWERRPQLAPPDAQDDVEVVPAQRFAATVSQRREDYRLALEQGSPRNAVVECWHLLETDAAAAGLPRRSSETSSEYVARMLALLGPAGEHTAYVLEGLYREARFSEHHVDESVRHQAQAALLELTNSLRQRSGVSGV